MYVCVHRAVTSLRTSKRRSALATGAIAASIAISVVLALTINLRDLWVATAILAISPLIFHAIAFITFDCTTCWRCVDYPCVLATFKTVLIALTLALATGLAVGVFAGGAVFVVAPICAFVVVHEYLILPAIRRAT